jgi:hypothetical protein
MSDRAYADAERPWLEPAKNECAADVGDRHRRLTDDFYSSASYAEARLRVRDATSHLGRNLRAHHHRLGRACEQQTDDCS